MSTGKKRDWDQIQRQITERYGKALPSVRRLSIEFGVPRETMRGWLIRTRQSPGEDSVKLVDLSVGQMKIKTTADGEQEAIMETSLPKTPEEVAEAVGIDISQYDVVSFESFAREVFVKDQDKDLIFDEGQITSTIRSRGKLNLQVVWSTRVLFRPKIMPAQKVQLQPVNITIPPERLAAMNDQPHRSDLTVVIPDIHFGFTKYGQRLSPMHDEEALEIVTRRVAQLNPTNIVLLGDVVDLAELSTFQANPNQLGLVQEALIAAASFLGELHLAAPNAKKYWIEGNHEQRFSRFISRQFPTAFNLKTVDGRLVSDIRTYLPGLEEFKVTYVPNYPDSFIKIGGVIYEHGSVFSTTPGGSVGKALKSVTNSVVFGHSHRAEIAYLRPGRSYESLFAFNAGCLCHIDGRVPGSNAKMNWQVGFGVVEDGNPIFYQLK